MSKDANQPTPRELKILKLAARPEGVNSRGWRICVADGLHYDRYLYRVSVAAGGASFTYKITAKGRSFAGLSGATKYPPLSLADVEVLNEAMGQLADMINMANGDLDGGSALEQVEETRAAMSAASKVITKWRRQAVEQSR